jgi:hypothetical protein
LRGYMYLYVNVLECVESGDAIVLSDADTYADTHAIVEFLERNPNTPLKYFRREYTQDEVARRQKAQEDDRRRSMVRDRRFLSEAIERANSAKVKSNVFEFDDVVDTGL